MSKRNEEEAYERLKLVEKEYKDARKRTDRMYELEKKAEEEVDRLTVELSKINCRIDGVWNDYRYTRNCSISFIGKYSEKANKIHGEMEEYFNEARFAKYNYHDDNLASVYYEKAYSCKERRDELNKKVKELKDEREEALNEAKYENEGLERARDLLEDELRRVKKDHDKKKSIRERLEMEEDELLREVGEAAEEYRNHKI